MPLYIEEQLEAVPDWDPEDCSNCFQCRPMATQLYYVSRAISEGVRSILYSRNFFRCYRGASAGLARLLYLTPVGIRSLHQLSIRLGRCLVDGLDDAKPVDNAFLHIVSDWRQLCARLAANLGF